MIKQLSTKNPFTQKNDCKINKNSGNVQKLIKKINDFDVDVLLYKTQEDYYKPLQCDDLYMFILENFEFSQDLKNLPILPQHVLTMFLYYCVMRKNSNVRISKFFKSDSKDFDFLRQADFALKSTDYWKEIDFLSKSTLYSQDSIKEASNEGSLFDVVLKKIQSSKSNPLSIDALGNFLYHFRERINYLSSKKMDGRLIEEKGFVFEEMEQSYQIFQVTLIKNLKLKSDAWLNERALIKFPKLKTIDAENVHLLKISEDQKHYLQMHIFIKPENKKLTLVKEKKNNKFSIEAILDKIKENNKFVKVGELCLKNVQSKMSREELNFLLDFPSFPEVLYYIAEYSLKFYIISDAFTKSRKKDIFRLRNHAFEISKMDEQKIIDQIPQAHRTQRVSSAKKALVFISPSGMGK